MYNMRLGIMLLLGLPIALFYIAKDVRAETVYNSEALHLLLGFPRPQQIAAFYEGRGFSKPMIDIIRQQCFVNVIIHNKSQDILWLDLTQWQFNTSDRLLQRLDRTYWQTRWASLNIPQPHRSTFRWTLIPRQLDLHPQEGEGGNLILPRQAKPFSLVATFVTGANKQGTPIVVRFDNLQCGVDP